jgi:hypothetical protein
MEPTTEKMPLMKSCTEVTKYIRGLINRRCVYPIHDISFSKELHPMLYVCQTEIDESLKQMQKAIQEDTQIAMPTASLWLNIDEKSAHIGYQSREPMSAPYFKNRERFIHVEQ